MVGSSHEGPGRRSPEKTSLFGLVSFQPRLAIVLVLLTITVAVVGVRISRDSGFRRADDMVRVALKAYSAPSKEGPAVLDPGDLEARVREWTGARIVLPRDEGVFSYAGSARARLGRQAGAWIRLSFSGEPYLLFVVPRNAIGGPSFPESLFSDSGFLSGEKEGKSFVFWEREGVSYVIVTESELERAFDLVRRYFT